MIRPNRWRSAGAVVAIGALLVSCGGAVDDGAPAGLSPAAEVGAELVRDKGCVSCHGSNGTGGVGPAWIGLAGSIRPLDDGTEVTADRSYLARAVGDPQAEQVSGYNILMPQVPLTDAEVGSIVDYLLELS